MGWHCSSQRVHHMKSRDECPRNNGVERSRTNMALIWLFCASSCDAGGVRGVQRMYVLSAEICQLPSKQRVERETDVSRIPGHLG